MSAEIDIQWWLEDEGQAHGKMLDAARAIRAASDQRRLKDLLHESMYGGVPSRGLPVAQAGFNLLRSRLALNVVRNMIGAVTSKVAAKNKPKPTFLTEEGNYELREKAEKLEKFTGGVFYDSKVYQALTQCFRDACVYGTGCLKVYPSDKRVEVDRVPQKDLIVDEDAARNGDPREMYHEDWYDVGVVKAKWAKDDAELQEAIERAKSKRDPDDWAADVYRIPPNRVRIVEGWHLGEDDETKGRHIIAVEGATLLDEPWEGPLPFVFMRWAPATEGFFGVGLAEELAGIQAEINKLLQQIQRGHHLIAGHWLVEQGAKVTTAHLNNDLASIVKYAGTRPEYNAPNIIAPEVYNHLWQLYAKAFEIAGISQLNATGQKPAGLDSGAAQRAYQETQTERFLEVGQDFEEFVIEAARQVVRCAKRVGGKYRVPALGKGSVTFIDWSDIDIEEDLYVIRVYPTSMLPSTPAGRLAWAQDMINSGAIPPEDVLDIVDFPDTEQYAKRRNAPRKLIERNVSHILKTGEFVSPEPFDDHKLALRLVNEAYHEARLDGVPEERLELLRRYMTDTQDFLGQEMPPAAPPMPPMPMDPMGAPPPGMPPAMPPGPPMPPPGVPPMPMAA